jgi:uncharacterized protein YfaS (alpha-2-macroglobulin family)
MKKPVLILFLLHFFFNSNAQLIKDPSSDQTVISAQSANDSLSLIEKVYVHTDRTYYFPGEDIWFKAYLIDAFDHLLSNHSNNLHVELISPSSKITDSRIIRLEDGLGNGDFKLPDSIRSGR